MFTGRKQKSVGPVDVLVAAGGAPEQAEVQLKRWWLFAGSLVLSSLLPMILLPAVGSGPPTGTLPFYSLLALQIVSANFHVGATGWFFTDREMRQHFRDRPVRYIFAPILTIAGNTAAFAWGGEGVTNYVTVGFFAWLLWHYQKQNVGILSFVCAGTKQSAPSVWERRTLMLAAIAGIICLLSTMRPGLPGAISEVVRKPAVQLALLAPSLVAFVAAVATGPSLLKSPLRTFTLVYGAVFFVPVFVMPELGIAPFATAHGLQYVVFMIVLSSRSAATIPSILAMLVMATLGYLLLDNHEGIREWLGVLDRPWFMGLTMAVVMSHFILDAGIWRLREPFQRGYMRRKFDFVFR